MDGNMFIKISFFFREVEYHIQSNTNSKTIVLNNTIIHPNELTDIGMRGISESVYRRRTDNTMTKRKRTKGQTMIYKIYI
jgi:hypothetical protein